ncbi:MAG: formylglycine-generating enzyme family protein [Acidobacteria bacterium]|nr:formylglycine-generating enzyme family protein [Acidobacteriota bacterium]
MVDQSLLQVVRIPAGEFVMGSDDGEEDERPPHRAYLDEFCIGINPVTNAEYAQFVHETGHPSPAVRALPLMVSGVLEADFRKLAASYCWSNGIPPEGRERHPVTLVGFDDATAYCEWLASKTGKPVRLPTEAEWEKAARGGQEGKRYPWGDTLDPACAHFLPQTGVKEERGTAPVGSYPPNGFPLHDMAGNVWECVADWYAPNYYARAVSRSAGPRRRVDADRPRRSLGQRRGPVSPVRLPAQSAARQLCLQHRLPRHACGAMKQTFLRPPVSE